MLKKNNLKIIIFFALIIIILSFWGLNNFKTKENALRYNQLKLIKKDTLIKKKKDKLIKKINDLFEKCKFSNLTENSFYKKNYELLYNSKTGAYSLYNLTFDDFKDFKLTPFFLKEGYKMTAENYPSKIFVFGCYDFSKDIKGLTLLNHAEGGYVLYLLIYQNNQPKLLYENPIAFSWNDIGFTKFTKSNFIAPNIFSIDTKEYFQDKMTKHICEKIKIDTNGNIVKLSVVLAPN